jgi:hypothetical protein
MPSSADSVALVLTFGNRSSVKQDQEQESTGHYHGISIHSTVEQLRKKITIHLKTL